MNSAQRLGKLLLWVHLFVCIVWWCVFHWENEIPEWMGHVIVWSILGIQFSWGVTVGLLVGPSRKRRSLLWWSLLLVFMPLFPIGHLVYFLFVFGQPLLALMYLAFFTIILACETYCGVLLGARMHHEKED